jgi:hypothetical protein
MNGQTILNYLDSDTYTKHIPRHFLYPDTNINIIQYPALIIINTDSSKGPGEHWCVSYFNDKYICDYFDPLGFPPNNTLKGYNFTSKLFPFCQHIIHNTLAVQTETSNVCGHHCLYFTFLKARKYSLNEIIEKFYSVNPIQNDKFVRKFISNL